MRADSVGVGEALLRGLASSRANWPLVVVRWLQDLLTFGLAGFGLLLPWLTVFGRDVLYDLAPLGRAESVDDLAEAVLDLWDVVVASPDGVTWGIAGLVVTWMMALVIYCWAQGGIWAILAASEAESNGKPVRAFAWRRFGRLAGRYFWRVFWLINLYATAVLALIFFWLLPFLWLPRSVDGGPSWGAWVVGLVLLVPFGLAAVAAALWYAVARADLVVAGRAVKETSRHAWRRLRRSPATPILVSLAALAGFAAVSALLAPLSGVSLTLGGLGGLAGDGGSAGLLGTGALLLQGLLFAVQGLVVGWLATVHSAALVAWASSAPQEAP